MQALSGTLITLEKGSERSTEAYGYGAITQGFWASGDTPSEAIEELFNQFSPGVLPDRIILRKFGPDEFFGAEPLRRLEALQDRLRTCGETGEELTTHEQEELEELLDQYMEATERRCEAIHRELSN